MVDNELITVRSLAKKYGDIEALREISFDVNRGETFGILGPNGAGKTSLVECMQGLRKPTSGEISVFGLSPQHDRDRLAARIGSQLQESALPERMKVKEALRLFAELHGSGADWQRVMSDWSLDEIADRSYGDLSGGQQQRTFLALAVLNDPEVLFLDELTQGLDPAARRMTWELLGEIQRRGTTIVLVTHMLEEAQHLCDRTCIIADGRVIAQGTTLELTKSLGAEDEITFTGNHYSDQALDELRGLESLSSVESNDGRMTIRGSEYLLSDVATVLLRFGPLPQDLRVKHADLEAAYMKAVEASR